MKAKKFESSESDTQAFEIERSRTKMNGHSDSKIRVRSFTRMPCARAEGTGK
jgi:hypothetical protein